MEVERFEEFRLRPPRGAEQPDRAAALNSLEEVVVQRRADDSLQPRQLKLCRPVFRDEVGSVPHNGYCYDHRVREGEDRLADS